MMQCIVNWRKEVPTFIIHFLKYTATGQMMKPNLRQKYYSRLLNRIKNANIKKMTDMKTLLAAFALISVSLASAQKTDSLPPHVYRWDSLVTTIEDTRVRKQVLEGSTTSMANFESNVSSLQPGKAPH